MAYDHADHLNILGRLRRHMRLNRSCVARLWREARFCGHRESGRKEEEQGECGAHGGA